MEFNTQPAIQVRRHSPWALIIIVVVLVLAFIGVIGYQSNWWRPMSGWQAVFLSNGQVYFGNVTSISPDTIVLKKIYYLQTSGPLQAGGEQQAQDLALVKLGSELHGPTDEMIINWDQILFIENLKADSKVVKAIEQFSSR
ncbi:MAG TPA: hypothetical protein DIS54_01945 [Candidatus Veblenbacteria bacterium]|nr:hypothetical protein [Candidatus Veblenbacteria bacterium]